MQGVTADTNVYVSALAFGGKPLQILEMAAQGLIRLSISDAILGETIRVLGDKFQWEKAALREPDATIRSIAEIVTPTQVVDVVKTDPPDNRVLECAADQSAKGISPSDSECWIGVRWRKERPAVQINCRFGSSKRPIIPVALGRFQSFSFADLPVDALQAGHDVKVSVTT